MEICSDISQTSSVECFMRVIRYGICCMCYGYLAEHITRTPYEPLRHLNLQPVLGAIKSHGTYFTDRDKQGSFCENAQPMIDDVSLLGWAHTQNYPWISKNILKNRSRIHNKIYIKWRGVINHPYLNFKGGLPKLRKWISDYIPAEKIWVQLLTQS